MEITLNGIRFVLLIEKALFQPDQRLLIIADVHLGKAAHFRRAGIAIPRQVQDNDYRNLRALLLRIDPLKVYFLGDLFHSEFNNDWGNFCTLIESFPGIEFTLLRGNHDIIDDKLFDKLRINIVDEITDGQLIYTHEPQPEIPAGCLNIVGHVHPGYRLYGAARQSVILPCFYITRQTCILPAFGVLTGLYGMARTTASDIYLVTPGGVRKWEG